MELSEKVKMVKRAVWQKDPAMDNNESFREKFKDSERMVVEVESVRVEVFWDEFVDVLYYKWGSKHPIRFCLNKQCNISTCDCFEKEEMEREITKDFKLYGEGSDTFISSKLIGEAVQVYKTYCTTLSTKNKEEEITRKLHKEYTKMGSIVLNKFEFLLSGAYASNRDAIQIGYNGVYIHKCAAKDCIHEGKEEGSDRNFYCWLHQIDAGVRSNVNLASVRNHVLTSFMATCSNLLEIDEKLDPENNAQWWRMLVRLKNKPEPIIKHAYGRYTTVIEFGTEQNAAKFGPRLAIYYDGTTNFPKTGSYPLCVAPFCLQLALRGAFSGKGDVDFLLDWGCCDTHNTNMPDNMTYAKFIELEKQISPAQY